MLSRHLLATVLATSLAAGVVSVPNTPVVYAAPAPSEAVKGNAAYLTAGEFLAAPYADTLGFTPVRALATKDARSKVLADYRAELPEGRDAAADLRYRQLENLLRTMDYVQDNPGVFQASTLLLSKRGRIEFDKLRTRHAYTYDNRDFTGLYISPKFPQLDTINTDTTNHVSVFYLWSDSDNTEVFFRQIGETDGDRAHDARGEGFSLKRGFNRIEYKMKDGATRPYAIYVRNQSTMRANVRLMAEDAWKGARPGTPTNQEARDAHLPVTAITEAVGSQFSFYPVYVHDPANPGNFFDFLTFARNHRETNMMDLRYGFQDVSVPADKSLEIFADITTREQAAETATKAAETFKHRLDFFNTFEGFDVSQETTVGSNNLDPADVPSTMQTVTLFDNTVRNPSSLYAWYLAYHINGSTNALQVLKGNAQTLFDWANSHEYGHMMDNSKFYVAEVTNNIYSIAGAMERARMMYREGGEPTLRQIGHQNLEGSQVHIDQWLQTRISNPSAIPVDNTGSFAWAATKGIGGVFLKTQALYPLFRYWDDYDYSNYPYGSSPFTPELAESNARYSTYGTMLRKIRKEPSWFDQFGPIRGADGSREVTYGTIAAMASYASGYNMCTILERRGYTEFTQVQRDFCAQYPEAPVKLEYYREVQDLAQVRFETLGTNPVFDEDVAATYTVDGTAVNMATTGKANAVDFYEIYVADKLVGFTRGATYTLAEGVNPDDVRVIAYDYRLNPSITEVEVRPENGEDNSTVTIAADGTARTPSEPVKEGFTFTGWLVNGKVLPADASFSIADTLGKALVAQWEPIPTTTEETTTEETTSEEPTTEETTSEEPTTEETTTSEEPTTEVTTTSQEPTTSEETTTSQEPTTSEEPTTEVTTTSEEPTTSEVTTSTSATPEETTTSEEPTTEATTTVATTTPKPSSTRLLPPVVTTVTTTPPRDASSTVVTTTFAPAEEETSASSSVPWWPLILALLTILTGGIAYALWQMNNNGAGAAGSSLPWIIGGTTTTSEQPDRR